MAATLWAGSKGEVEVVTAVMVGGGGEARSEGRARQARRCGVKSGVERVAKVSVVFVVVAPTHHYVVQW